MNKIWLGALAVAGCCTAASCFGDGGAAVSGRVRDRAGNPIAGAHIYIKTTPSPSHTSAQRIIASGNSQDDGCFDVSGTHVGGKLPLRLEVNKQSFKPYNGNFESVFFTNDVILISDASEGESTGQFVQHDFKKSGKAPCQQ